MGRSTASRDMVLREIKNCVSTHELLELQELYGIDDKDDLHSVLLEKYNKIRVRSTYGNI